MSVSRSSKICQRPPEGSVDGPSIISRFSSTSVFGAASTRSHPGWSSLHFSEAGYQFCRFLSPPVLMCAVLMKPWLLFHPSFEGSGQARLEEPLSGEETHKVRGDRFSSFHRSKFLLPQDDQVPPHLVTRPLLNGLGVGPPGWMTPRDRRPRGAPPVGQAATNENLFSAVATDDDTIPLDAGRKDSCRNRTSGRRR